MTKPLAKTNRDLLEEILAAMRQREIDAATIQMLSRNVERLLREKEALMGVIARATIERLIQTQQPQLPKETGKC